MKLSERIEKIAKTVEVQRHVKTARVSKEDADRLVELADDIYGKVDEVSRLLQRIDSHKYEAWKAYGKHVTDEFHIMGPNLVEIANSWRDYKEFDIEEIYEIMKELGITDYVADEEGVTVPADKEDDVQEALDKAEIPDDYEIRTK